MFALVAAVIMFGLALDLLKDPDWLNAALGFFFLNFFWNPWPFTYVVGKRGRQN
jgi:hypothetical protein